MYCFNFSINVEEFKKIGIWIQIWIFIKIESIRSHHTFNLSTKFCRNPSVTFWDIVLYIVLALSLNGKEWQIILVSGYGSGSSLKSILRWWMERSSQCHVFLLFFFQWNKSFTVNYAFVLRISTSLCHGKLFLKLQVVDKKWKHLCKWGTPSIWRATASTQVWPMYSEGNTSSAKGNSGRKHILQDRDVHAWIWSARQSRRATADQLTVNFNLGSEQPVSSKTVCCELHRLGYHSRVAVHKPLIIPGNAHLRV